MNIARSTFYYKDKAKSPKQMKVESDLLDRIEAICLEFPRYGYRRVTHQLGHEGKIAITRVGEVELELCQPIDGNSIYQDFLMEHGEGLHHLNFLVDNVDETTEILAKEGFPSIQSGCFGDTGAYEYIEIKPLRCIWKLERKSMNKGPKPI